ncbi:MAG: precorrin-2 C(20)-methyltransferase [Alphaproteobacteria bacterium]
MTASTLWGVGVGPGDPDLLTIKGLRVIERCPVVAYPAPPEGDSLARAIVAPHLAPGKIEIAIRMSLDPRGFPAPEVYDPAATAIAAHLVAGRDVAVLCEGDPFFYGSFQYLYARLAGRFRVEVVPGVSSLLACPAVAGAPLTARDDVLVVVPATLSEEALAEHLSGADAAAIVKVGRHLGKVRRVVERLGLVTRARLVEHATRPDQRVRALAEVTEDRAPYFSMVLVHRRGEAWR